MNNWIMACFVLQNFLLLRGEEDDYLAGAIGKTIQEESSPNNGFRNTQLEQSQAMKQAGKRLRASLRIAITGLDKHEEA